MWQPQVVALCALVVAVVVAFVVVALRLRLTCRLNLGKCQCPPGSPSCLSRVPQKPPSRSRSLLSLFIVSFLIGLSVCFLQQVNMVIVIVIGALPACNLAIWQSGNCNCNCNLQRVPNSGKSHNNTTTCCQAVNNSLGVAQVVVVAVAVAVLACNRLIIYGMLPCGSSNNNFSFDWSTWPNAALKILGRIYSAHQAAWDSQTDRQTDRGQTVYKS